MGKTRAQKLAIIQERGRSTLEIKNAEEKRIKKKLQFIARTNKYKKSINDLPVAAPIRAKLANVLKRQPDHAS